MLARNGEDAVFRRHLAILYLSDSLPLEAVYQIVADTTVATEHALDLVESGDLAQLTLTLAAAPEIASKGTTGAFTQTVLALASGNTMPHASSRY